ncbi:unnamed protein product [Sphagnum balticum]
MNKDALPTQDSLFSPIKYAAKQKKRAARLNTARAVTCAELPPVLDSNSSSSSDVCRDVAPALTAVDAHIGRAESSSPRVLPPPLTVPVVETRMCKPQAHRFASGSTNTASGGDVSTSGSPSEQLDASRCWPPGYNSADGIYFPVLTSTSYMKMLDGCTQKLIDFAKGLTAFRSLTPHDQAVLLKGGACPASTHPNLTTFAF